MKVVSTRLWTVLGRSALVVAIEVCVCSLPCCMGALLAPHEVQWVIKDGNASSDSVQVICWG